jgi:hypothetical protein
MLCAPTYLVPYSKTEIFAHLYMSIKSDKLRMSLLFTNLYPVNSYKSVHHTTYIHEVSAVKVQKNDCDM